MSFSRRLVQIQWVFSTGSPRIFSALRNFELYATWPALQPIGACSTSTAPRTCPAWHSTIISLQLIPWEKGESSSAQALRPPFPQSAQPRV